MNYEERIVREVDARESGDFTICPLCEEMVLGEDDTRKVWDSAPKAPPRSTRAFKEPMERSVGYSTGRGELPRNGIEVLGKPADEVAAIIEALERSDDFAIETKRRVEEAQFVGMDEPGKAVETTMSGKVFASVSAVAPDPPEPDHIMHEECYESIFGNTSNDD